MTPRVRRIVIPLVVLGIAVGIAIAVMTAGPRRPAPERGAPAQGLVDGGGETPASNHEGAADVDDAQRPSTGASDADVAAGVESADVASAGAAGAPPSVDEIAHWHAVAPAGPLGASGGLPHLGSFDPDRHRMRIEFAPNAAGIEQIVFSDYWESAGARRRAEAARRAGKAAPPELDGHRYVLQRALGRSGLAVPLLAMHSVVIEGKAIGLFGDVWSLDTIAGAAALVTEVRDANGVPQVRIGRRFTLGGDGYDLTIEQWAENISGAPLSVQLVHYGPADLRLDRDRYMDIRRYHFGYVLPGAPAGRPPTVITDGQMINRADVLKNIGKGHKQLWPTEETANARLSLSWYGTTNRYFAFALHPTQEVVERGVRTFESVAQIKVSKGVQVDSQEAVLTEVYTPVVTLGAGEVAHFDVAAYAGPLDPDVLGVVQPYEALGMSGLILYLMSDCCTMCTFPWLAKLLLGFLSLLHDWVLFDWALSIIGLVLVVRLLLHPIMKRSQVQMQRFGRAMGELKPEIERLQQKHKGDPQRLQAEQLRLYREKGVSPAGCVGGIVPTLLQMPIWIALYAMLYFAFELRQQPAFFGVFQLFGGWQFLADLSAADHFFWEFETTHQFLLWNLTGLNLLPLLMGLVFFFQQKYMTPPTTVKLSPEQQQQQKLMKIMMVVLFPLMLYSAPSGLTLYIMTSSLIGIFESRQIRKHIAQMDAMPKQEPKKKKQDMLGRMYEQALDRARERAAKKRKPTRRFKDREE